MRFAIFGDIHANFHALQAVMADAKVHACTHFVCMGDIVGYNAYPSECLEFIRKLDCPVVKGNHDEQAAMLGEQEGFNPLAEEAMNWTRARLSEDQKDWLRSLRLQRQVAISPSSTPRSIPRTSGGTFSTNSTRRRASTTSTPPCASLATPIRPRPTCATEPCVPFLWKS